MNMEIFFHKLTSQKIKIYFNWAKALFLLELEIYYLYQLVYRYVNCKVEGKEV